MFALVRCSFAARARPRACVSTQLTPACPKHTAPRTTPGGDAGNDPTKPLLAQKPDTIGDRIKEKIEQQPKTYTEVRGIAHVVKCHFRIWKLYTVSATMRCLRCCRFRLVRTCMAHGTLIGPDCLLVSDYSICVDDNGLRSAIYARSRASRAD